MSAQFPQVTRIYQNHHLDSTRWDAFRPRDNDIVISTSIKSGTTWTQMIVRELIVHSLGDTSELAPEQIPQPDRLSSPWLDSSFSRDLETMCNELEAQRHRRFIKSHLPLDGLPYYPQIKYLIIGRDARDVFMSFWNHYSNYTDDFYAAVNNPDKLVGEPCPRCPEDIHDLWRGWISRGWFEWEQEGFPFWSNMHHTQTWWNYRHLDNIELFHYGDMLNNTAAEIRRMAEFLSIDISDEAIAAIVEYTRLSTVRKRTVERGTGGRAFKDGPNTFFFKGTNGRWRDILTTEELEMYEKTKSRVLSPDCARWLELGRRGLSDEIG